MMQLGESFVGDGQNAAHLNTVVGEREGPVGTAWATALATPREGHSAFVVVAQPNVPVKPFTLFVNKATISSERHGTLTWGAGQIGVAAGVLHAVREGVFQGLDLEALVILAAVWIDPLADDEEEVYENNRISMLNALRNGSVNAPSVDAIHEASSNLGNGFYVPTQAKESRS
ncbi:MAG: formaldehyde-activating enzyme [Actinobacteria bacterium]|uniref:Unannotated protein n=1 Tax=freshwater metagenome TaxID=449393 RepID=A0A6J6ZAI0_9ZZZZ|nr:formaldehyde-activating enzyme [Actinomycetota bacterium]MSX09895.1 formaldehyde-activating enzyme [Actinomycetota bacterium]MSX67457.1 formaldehyde-activating enzyme [Actinomycetota bacterium]